MATITYANKDKTLPTSDVRRLVRDVDMNEIKSVVNTNDSGNTTSHSTLSSATATVASNLATHAALSNNPHAVTKAQVGLSNADNTSDATKLAAVFAKFVFKETPTGTINGINDDFTLAFSAVTVIGVYIDGTVINSAYYTVVGTALTITEPTVIPTNSIQIDYIK